MNPTVIALGVGGVAVVGVGLWVVHQRVAAEKRVGEIAPGVPGAYSPNIPTHTVGPGAPGAERELHTLRQMLTSYRQSLNRLESERMTIEHEIQQAESQGAAACDRYALDAVTEHRCQHFLFIGHSCWWEKVGTRVNPTVRDSCVQGVRGLGDIPPRGPGAHPAAPAGGFGELPNKINQAHSQALAARQKRVQAQGRVREVDVKIGELRMKIADLNARGVY